MIWLLIPVFALLYRFRGGGVFDLPGEKPDPAPNNRHTQIRRVTYAVGGGLALWAFGIHWFAAVAVAIILFLPMLLGFGVPIGAVAGIKQKLPYTEFEPFDVAASILGGNGLFWWGFWWLVMFFGMQAVLLALLPGLHSLWLILLAFIGIGYAPWGEKRDLGEYTVGALMGLVFALALTL